MWVPTSGNVDARTFMQIPTCGYVHLSYTTWAKTNPTGLRQKQSGNGDFWVSVMPLFPQDLPFVLGKRNDFRSYITPGSYFFGHSLCPRDVYCLPLSNKLVSSFCFQYSSLFHHTLLILSVPCHLASSHWSKDVGGVGKKLGRRDAD